MIKQVAAITVLVGAVGLSACSGSGGTGTGTTTSPVDRSTTVSAPASSASAASPTGKPTPSVAAGASASDIAKQAGCAPTKRSPEDTNVGPKPKTDLICKANGVAYEIETWDNDADMQAAKSVAQSLVKSFGITTYSLVGDRWNMSRYDTSTPAKDKLAVEAMQAKLGGQIIKLG